MNVLLTMQSQMTSCREKGKASSSDTRLSPLSTGQVSYIARSGIVVNRGPGLHPLLTTANSTQDGAENLML